MLNPVMNNTKWVSCGCRCMLCRPHPYGARSQPAATVRNLTGNGFTTSVKEDTKTFCMSTFRSTHPSNGKLSGPLSRLFMHPARKLPADSACSAISVTVRGPATSKANHPDRVWALGCAGVITAVNLLLMGGLAIIFSSGPYSSAAQETWYRGGSIGFLIFGAIMPICELLFILRKKRGSIFAVAIWACASLTALLCYVFMSSGGV
jgi:hypothetical protein